MPKTPTIAVTTVTFSVTALARKAGLPETVVGTLALHRFAEAVADAVMRQQGAVPAGVAGAEN